jgi:hypothetical protein
MRIPDKQTMRGLYLAGAFGNRWPGWPLLEYIETGISVPVGLMYNGTPGTQLPDYARVLPRSEIITVAERWHALGYSYRSMTASCGEDGADPRPQRTIQGEVMRSEEFYTLTWSNLNMMMRPALATRCYHETGLPAVLRLQAAMDRGSWENLQSIYDRYPDSVVEFTCYDRGVGVTGANTVFWEVRNY